MSLKTEIFKFKKIRYFHFWGLNQEIYYWYLEHNYKVSSLNHKNCRRRYILKLMFGEVSDGEVSFDPSQNQTK